MNPVTLRVGLVLIYEIFINLRVCRWKLVIKWLVLTGCSVFPGRYQPGKRAVLCSLRSEVFLRQCDSRRPVSLGFDFLWLQTEWLMFQTLMQQPREHDAKSQIKWDNSDWSNSSLGEIYSTLHWVLFYSNEVRFYRPLIWFVLQQLFTAHRSDWSSGVLRVFIFHIITLGRFTVCTAL